MIALKDVKSSMLQAYGYDGTSQTLAVRFSPGKIYHYKNVPPDVAEKVANAESIGKAFASLIRGQYEHTTILEEKNHGIA